MSVSSFALGAVAALIVMALASYLNTNRGPLDDTDNKVTGARSQMRILVDHGTGCQYLVSIGGGLTPRLDGEGKPMCRRPA